MFGIDKFSGVAGMVDFVFCIAVVLVSISLPFFILRVRNQMTTLKKRQQILSGRPMDKEQAA